MPRPTTCDSISRHGQTEGERENTAACDQRRPAGGGPPCFPGLCMRYWRACIVVQAHTAALPGPSRARLHTEVAHSSSQITMAACSAACGRLPALQHASHSQQRRPARPRGLQPPARAQQQQEGGSPSSSSSPAAPLPSTAPSKGWLWDRKAADTRRRLQEQNLKPKKCVGLTAARAAAGGRRRHARVDCCSALSSALTFTHPPIKSCRSLGQNFMLDDGVLADIVDAAGVGPGDLVLEIGPGASREAGCWLAGYRCARFDAAVRERMRLHISAATPPRPSVSCPAQARAT